LLVGRQPGIHPLQSVETFATLLRQGGAVAMRFRVRMSTGKDQPVPGPRDVALVSRGQRLQEQVARLDAGAPALNLLLQRSGLVDACQPACMSWPQLEQV